MCDTHLKKVLFSLAVIAACSSLQFTSCKKNKQVDVNPLSQSEVQAMKDFYKTTNGGTWTKTWDTANNDVSKWYGVVLREDFNSEGKLIQKIVSIKLPNNNLTGSLPASFGDLKNLEELNLSNNAIGGDVPASFNNLTELKQLNIVNNNLTGTISDDIVTNMIWNNHLNPNGLQDVITFYELGVFEVCPQQNDEGNCPF